MALWEKDPEAYITECLWIKEKQTGKEIPFVLNFHQKTLVKEVKRQLALGRPVRIRILKCRQDGMSTICEALIFWANRFFSGSRAMTVSLDNDSSEHLHTITKLFYERLPDSEKNILVPVNTSKRELKFQRPHGGHMTIETAGKKSAGHSFTIHQLHFSERPRWPEGSEDALIGLRNAVPGGPNTMILDETVANGMSGRFYKDWQKTDSDYTHIFLSWKDHKEYSSLLPCDDDSYIQTLSVDEQKLIAKHSLTLNQIEWRRSCIREKCDGDEDVFKEQYPLTASEAFRTTGKTFFDADKLDSLDTENDPLTGDLTLYETLGHKREIEFKPSKQGNLTLYRRPQQGRTYVIGSDIAEGLEIDGAEEGGRLNPHDFSSGDVLDRDTGEQVAHYHSRVTPDEFGRQLVILGQWYNMAFQAPENNAGYGQHVITEMLNQGYPHHLIYEDKSKNKMGWVTSNITRKPMLAKLDRSLRTRDIIINHRPTIDEMKGFTTRPNGKVEHGPGLHDDRVFSLAISNEMLEKAPVFNQTVIDQTSIVPNQPLVSTVYKQKSFRNRNTTAN